MVKKKEEKWYNIKAKLDKKHSTRKFFKGAMIAGAIAFGTFFVHEYELLILDFPQYATIITVAVGIISSALNKYKHRKD